MTSLCYHPLVKKQFTDGFLFIELGAQATDPSVKLCRLYHLLTGEHLRQGDINHAASEVQGLISNHYLNLLVIIDDVWHVEDAEPLLKAFSNCKIILTTRMNNIEQYLPSKQSVTIGPMTKSEAVSLLTNGVIDSSQLSQEDRNLLDDLAQDVHLWPLLLSLVRGQLSHYVKWYHSSYSDAIQKVQDKLHHTGLTAFDKNTMSKSRRLAVEACIGVTLELLSDSLKCRLKTLILYTGIGTKFQAVLLSNLWNISEQEAEEVVDTLWAYGLMQLTRSLEDAVMSCVEVHTVISQYFIESMEPLEVVTLSAFGPVGLHTARSVVRRMLHEFQQSQGVNNQASLSAIEYLKYKQSETETILLPHHLQTINTHPIYDPHIVMGILEEIKDTLSSLGNQLSSSCDKVESQRSECKMLLNDAHKSCRKLKQMVERNLYEKSYDILIQSLLELIREYPLHNVIEEAVNTVKAVMPYCDGRSSQILVNKCEHLQMMLPDYHIITTQIIPRIKFYIKTYELITFSLSCGSPSIEETYQHILSNEYFEEMDLVETNWLIKMQEVAPNYIQKLISLQQLKFN